MTNRVPVIFFRDPVFFYASGKLLEESAEGGESRGEFFLVRDLRVAHEFDESERGKNVYRNRNESDLAAERVGGEYEYRARDKSRERVRSDDNRAFSQSFRRSA